MYSVDGTLTTRIDCPNCRDTMQTRQFEAFALLRPIDVAICTSCSLMWFNGYQSVSLAPKSVLSLLQYIGQAASAARTPLNSSFRCPHCASALQFTHDLQRSTHFTYWRCPNDHGQLLTFTQFLREKNFIRPPSVEELAKLRATVRQISCSQCGAPIDLAKDSACSHCGAPIALIDAEGVAKALRELSAASTTQGAAPDPDKLQNALRDAQINAIFDVERMREREDRKDDLLAIGATAVAGLIAGLVFGRL